jgi:exopolyphosphatase/pppGpp-phosphohydrolase
MNPRRADIIVGGAVILDTILADLELSEIGIETVGKVF